MIEKITENLNVIEELPDKPTISSTELKRKFDFAGNTIKNFINNKLIPVLEGLFPKKGGTVEGNLSVNGNLTVAGITKVKDIEATSNIKTSADITGNNINVLGKIIKGGKEIPTITSGTEAPNVSQMQEGEIYLQYK